MFKTSTSIIIGALAVLAGVVLIFCNNLIDSKMIVSTGGLMFIVAGVLNGLMTFFVKDASGNRRSKGAPFVFNIIASAAAVAFGICMLVLNEDFQKLIPIVFSVLILFGALMLFYFLGFGSRDLDPAKWLFAFPVLVLIGAIAVYLLKSPDDDSRIMIFTGLSIVFFGLGIGLTAANIAAHARKARRIAAAPSAKADGAKETVPAEDMKGLE